MSGDVHTRKRKDKKRRKDSAEALSGSPPPVFTPKPTTTSTPSDDEPVNLHVYHDGGTGGNICAKIIFFFLFSTLIVLVGLIINEHRGLTELDNVQSESRFAQIFEGWVDNSPAHDHSEEVHLEEHDHDEHDHEDEHGGHSEEEQEEHEEHSEEHEEHSEEEETHEEEEEDEPASQQDLTEEEEEEPEQSQELNASQPEEDEEEEPQDEEELESAEQEQEPESAEQQESVEEQEDELEQEEPEPEEELQDELEQETEAEQDQKPEQPEEDEAEPQEALEQDEEQPDNVKLAMRVGVGAALLVVAQVLVRKWKSEDGATPAAVPVDITRRNTFVPPPTIQQVQQEIEDYSNEEGEVDSEEEVETEAVQSNYESLRQTYNRSFTPESEEEEKVEEEYEDDEEVEEVEEEEVEETDSEYEDDDLLKRLESKYGKLSRDEEDVNPEEEIESNPVSEDEEEEEGSDADVDIRAQIEEAEKASNENAALAIKLFDAILEHHPSSPRSLYGRAYALDVMADQRRSNEILNLALDAYLMVLQLDSVPDGIFLKTAEKCIERMRFIGQYSRVVSVHKMLINRFPDDPKHRNDLAVSYLSSNRVAEAKDVLKNTLTKWPDNGFAAVHYGFILKTSDNDLKNSVHYMTKGIRSREPGVVDGRFYFHLGDALTRLGKPQEANTYYEEAVSNKLFPSKYQRSIYNVNHLKAQPWWDKKDLPHLQTLFTSLQSNWKAIRDEGLSMMTSSGFFRDESENLRDTGVWKQFELMSRGKIHPQCSKTPKTCHILKQHSDVASCRRGQSKFSVMHPKTHVWPHCGPTNCRLRIHLGLKIPPGTYLRVAEETRSWGEGEILVFDDSFEHEVWHNGTSNRLVLIVDVWHPDLTNRQKNSLSPI